MNTALVIIGLSMLIFLVVFYLKRAKEKRKAWLEEREKIKAYGEGEKYIGQWKDSDYHGKGTLTINDPPQKYVGEFKNGKKHGRGVIFETLTDKGDTIATKGIWENDKFVKKN